MKLPGADADQRHTGLGDLAQIARGGVVDLRARVEEAADHDDIVEGFGGQKTGRGLDHHPTTRRHRLLATRHDRPLHVQGPAAIAFVGSESEMINEDREGGEREVLCQDDAHTQRLAYRTYS